MLRRVGAWSLRAVLGVAALVVVIALLTRQPGDPALYPPSANESAVEIAVVSHGYHTGLALPRALVLGEAGRQGFPALINVATRFGPYRWVEIGWGEEEFYREVPAPGALGIGMALRALFWPGNRSVLHVVGLADEPEAMFPDAEIVRLRLSEAGFRRMLAGIDRSFALEARLPQDMGQGLYGPSLFYRAHATFSAVNLCNHSTGRMLAEAGLSGFPVAATVPPGLLWSVRRQARGDVESDVEKSP